MSWSASTGTSPVSKVHDQVRRLGHVHGHDVEAVRAEALDDRGAEPAVGARDEGAPHDAWDGSGLTAP